MKNSGEVAARTTRRNGRSNFIQNFFSETEFPDYMNLFIIVEAFCPASALVEKNLRTFCHRTLESLNHKIFEPSYLRIIKRPKTADLEKASTLICLSCSHLFFLLIDHRKTFRPLFKNNDGILLCNINSSLKS